MNLYFLVEGVTERKIYPRWLEYLLPSLTRIFSPDEAGENSYYLISGGGFPSLLDSHLTNSVRDITDSGNYDYFIIALDADDIAVHDKIEEVTARIAHESMSLGRCELKVVVQNRCIETWLLGNRIVFSRNPTTEALIQCIRFYNVFDNDPELMFKPVAFEESVASFHYEYLRLMLTERNIRYSKKYPKDTLEPYYIEQLKNRLRQTSEHLNSLQDFFDFCTSVRQRIEENA